MGSPKQPSHDEEKSMSEQIGEMAEGSQGSEPGGKDHQAQDSSNKKGEEHQREERPRNPKKRMWDENVEAKKLEERQKDEL